MMRALEMDHSLAKAKEMMLEIDEDGSGELEFGEFCALLAKVKRGDVGNLHGFAKLTEDIKATPVSVLNIEVLKRGLKSKYRFVETREATAMYDKYEVMEVTLSGHWYEIVKGQPKVSDSEQKMNLNMTWSRRWRRRDATSRRCRLHDHMRVYASRGCTEAMSRLRPCHTGVLRRPILPGHRQDDARGEAGRREGGPHEVARDDAGHKIRAGRDTV